MAFKKIQEIKDRIPIADFLQRLGYTPVKTGERRSQYFSMIRDDGKNPSFYVDHRSQTWHDYGQDKWGSVIDLAMEIYHTDSFTEIIQQFNDIYHLGHVGEVPAIVRRMRGQETPTHELVHVRRIGQHQALTDYLKGRGVLKEAWQSDLVREVFYNHVRADGSKKAYFGVGWQNISGGWEVRSAMANGGKICLAPKDVLYKAGSTRRANIFEGMMDYLSALKENPDISGDHLYVMNSTGLSRRTMDKLKDQPFIGEIDLYLDNGQGGRHFTAEFLATFAYAHDKAYLYKAYDDYNDKIKAGLAPPDLLVGKDADNAEGRSKVGIRR